MLSRMTCHLIAGSVLALAVTANANAQSTAPSSVTPQSLRPQEPIRNVEVAIPESGGLEPPAGAAQLSVKLDKIVVDGAFPEMSAATDAIVAPLRGRSASLAEIWHAASQIESAYARAGYVLARIVVPPQSLVDGGVLRIVLVDGFIESIDFNGVPARARHAVAKRVAALKGRHHIRLSDIEQALLVAGDVPGLRLSSTLARGTEPGAATLILAGQQSLVSGLIGADNSLASSLGTYGFNAQVSLNSAFGLGEQIYASAASGYDLSQLFSAGVPVRVLGAGAVVPLADGRLTVNPEVTFSRTQPAVDPQAPQTRGVLRRLSLRLGYTAFRTRARALTIGTVVEQIDEINALPAFGVDISHDRFMAARLSATYTSNPVDGSAIIASGELSQGLGGLGALPADALPTGTTFSRQGASLGFTKLDLSLRGLLPTGRNTQLTVTLKGQSSFGKPLFRSEQTMLEGSDAASAYVGGVTALDEAITARAEFGGTVPLAQVAVAHPYVFAAGGIGRDDRPTVLEPSRIAAGSTGVGVRAVIVGTGLSFNAEIAHGFADFAPLSSVNRLNVSISLRF